MTVLTDRGKVKTPCEYKAPRPDRPRMERVTAWSENLEGKKHDAQHR
jgi:hypothetical protein